jgi:hypothetical protein
MGLDLDSFLAVLDVQNKRIVAPFQLTMKSAGGKQNIYVLIKHHWSGQVQFEALIHSEFKCRKCVCHAMKMAPLTDNIGDQVLLPIGVVSSAPTCVRSHLRNVHKAVQSACKGSEVGLYIVTSEDVNENAGGFRHYAMNSLVTDADVDIDFIKAAISKYAIDLMPKLERELKGREAAFMRVMDAVQTVTYASMLTRTLSWMIRLMQSEDAGQDPPIIWRTQLMLDAGLERDMNGPVCKTYHQANGIILRLMDSENCVAEMAALLAPDVYRRFTAPPSGVAISMLGDFTNTVMTLSEASKLPGATLVPLATDRSVMHVAFKLDSCSVDSLMEIAKLGYSIEIATADKQPMYVAKTTLAFEKRSVPHFWSYSAERKITDYIDTKWARVSLIVPMYKYIGEQHVLFVLPDCVVKDIPFDCCFPEFLSTKYTRSCGKAFEEGSKTEMPEAADVPIAFGIGSSGDKNILVNPVDVRIDGSIILRITHMKS